MEVISLKIVDILKDTSDIRFKDPMGLALKLSMRYRFFEATCDLFEKKLRNIHTSATRAKYFRDYVNFLKEEGRAEEALSAARKWVGLETKNLALRKEATTEAAEILENFDEIRKNAARNFRDWKNLSSNDKAVM